MGLLKAAFNAVSGTFSDQWLDLIKCENMDMDTLMVKQTTKTGQISKDSRIIVAPGQVAVIYDSGSVLDATAEEGIYTFDKSTSPSFFAGQFGPVFKEMWQRFTYGGTPAKEQAVFYFNTKEILNNKFGTPSPILFPDYKHPMDDGEPLILHVGFSGLYTFRLDDMGVFMRNHAGTGDVIKKSAITEQMRSEVVDALQGVVNTLGSTYRIGVHEIPSAENKKKIQQLLEEFEYDTAIRARGIRLVSFTIPTYKIRDDDEQFLKEYQQGSSSRLAKGSVLGTLRAAGENESGAGSGVLGVGMMNMGLGLGGNIMQNMYPQQPQGGGAIQPNNPTQGGPQQPTVPQGVPCPKCGQPVTGNFCSNCGTEMPKPKAPKKCPKCGCEVTGNFCSNCGTACPDNDGPKKCPKCGNEVNGNFCSNCGTRM